MSDTNEQEKRESEDQISDEALESVAGGIVGCGLTIPIIKIPIGGGEVYPTIVKTVVICPAPSDPKI